MNKEYVYSDLFKLLPQSSKVSKIELVPDGKTPAYSSATRNNGCVGFVNKEPLFNITKKTPVYLVFGDHTRTMNIVHEDFCVMDNVKVLAPLLLMSDEVLLYITTCWKKAIPNLGYARHWSVAKIARFKLPVIESPDPDHEYTVEDIDFEYMQERIAELEKERIAELEKELDVYLTASGLEDYELTDEDKEILSLPPESASDKADAPEADCEDGQIRFKRFALGDVFNIYSPKKRFNANTVQFGGKYPYVARGSSNNGIRGYITEDEQYLSPAKSLSFGQDTATVFYQPDAYFTGDKIKVMILNNHDLNDELAQYLITVITKRFSTFAWGQSSFNEKILKATEIVLSVIGSPDPDHEYTVGDIDFEYIERYIRAIEKLAIADVAKYKDKLITTTKRVVGA